MPIPWVSFAEWTARCLCTRLLRNCQHLHRHVSNNKKFQTSTKVYNDEVTVSSFCFILLFKWKEFTILSVKLAMSLLKKLWLCFKNKSWSTCDFHSTCQRQHQGLVELLRFACQDGLTFRFTGNTWQLGLDFCASKAGYKSQGCALHAGKKKLF